MKVDMKAGRTFTVRAPHLRLTKVEHKERSGFAGEHGEMKMEQYRCELVFRGELHLTPCG